jgi:capreomycidine synthase
MSLPQIAPALLEDWFRDRYFAAQVDISSSGVENYSLGELRLRLGIDTGELDALMFRDSPSRGTGRLRAAIAGRVPRAVPEDVMVTHGSSEAIFLALAALISPGDEVVVPAPAYQSLTSVAEALGGRLRVWALDERDDFRPDPSRLETLIGPCTRAVVVNFPHNPTGAVPSEECYQTLLALADRYGTYLLWDAAFDELCYDGYTPPSPHGQLERVVVTGTLSKAYGLPGLRVGWCLADGPTQRAMVRLRDYVSISTSPLAEYLAARVLENAELIVGPRREQAAINRKTLLDWWTVHEHLVHGLPPAGGVTAFPRFPLHGDVTGLCARLAAERGVLVVPGACFGHPDRMRIGFGGPAGELDWGLEILASMLAASMRRKGASDGCR